MRSDQAPAISARPGRASLTLRVAAMRRSGMSGTAIRRALGLSAAQAVGAGIIAPNLLPGAAKGPPAPRAGAPAPPAGPCMAEVLAAVARAAELPPEALLGPGQDRRSARPRQLVMYLLRTLCAGASLPAIGHFLGRDHTTVLHGCRRAEALLVRDPAFQALHARARVALAPPPAGPANHDAETAA